MEEKKEKTFEDVKDEVVVNEKVSKENEEIIVNTARKEIELERAARKK